MTWRAWAVALLAAFLWLFGGQVGDILWSLLTE